MALEIQQKTTRPRPRKRMKKKSQKENSEAVELPQRVCVSTTWCSETSDPTTV